MDTIDKDIKEFQRRKRILLIICFSIMIATTIFRFILSYIGYNYKSIPTDAKGLAISGIPALLCVLSAIVVIRVLAIERRIMQTFMECKDKRNLKDYNQVKKVGSLRIVKSKEDNENA